MAVPKNQKSLIFRFFEDPRQFTKSEILELSGLVRLTLKYLEMFWVYIIQSLKNKIYYIGQTNNIERRLRDHNRGKDHSSKIGRPWISIYNKKFASRKEAMKFEKYLKSLKNRKAIEKIIVAG